MREAVQPGIAFRQHGDDHDLEAQCSQDRRHQPQTNPGERGQVAAGGASGKCRNQYGGEQEHEPCIDRMRGGLL